MPQRFDEYEDAETVYEQEEEDDYEEEYEEGPSSPYESSFHVDLSEDDEEEDEEHEEEVRPLSRGATPVEDTWQSMFHTLRGTEGTTVTWAEMRAYLDTLNIESFPPRASVPLYAEKTQVPDKSARVERMSQELLANEEAYKVLKASLKDLRASLKVSTEKQVAMAEQVAQQEKKKPYKWGPPSKKVITPLEAELKKLDAEIAALRDMIDKVETKERSAVKDLTYDRKSLEEAKEMWEVYKQYTAFEHTLVGPVLH